jgi:uncharacterized phage protein gp47/JayE
MVLSDLVYIDSTGYHYADYPTFLQWRTDQYKAIYGSDVYLGSDSQDGELLAIQAKSDYDTAALGASIYASFSPVTAQGTGLARVVKINGLIKGSATNSSVDLVLVGTVGTLITNGIAIDTLKQKWVLPTSVLIPISGTITVTATSQDAGAIHAEAGTITGIFTPTLGWLSVTNPSAATAGKSVESDAELRARQAVSTADPSQTILAGTVGSLLNLSGVTQCVGYENDTGIVDANGQDPHSIAIMILGGTDSAIANTILIHKTPGTYTYGTTPISVTDSKGMPYVIRFSRPTVAEIGVEITLSAKTGWTTDFESLIASAVATEVNNFGIGKSVLLTRLFSAAYLGGASQSQTYDISQIRLKKGAGSFAASNITIVWNEYPNCNALTDFTFIVT